MKHIELVTYSKAIDAHVRASTALYTHVVHQTEPTTRQIQHKEDARVMLVAARAAYFAGLS